MHAQDMVVEQLGQKIDEKKGTEEQLNAKPRLQINKRHLILSWAGKVALALNSDLSIGFTHRTHYWGNPPLTKVDKADNSFLIRHVELWGFEGF
mmetsp:Transcript_4912/g.8916  ORF Transcript_4912/g.8916 Transcript_4912/m.8916 type:complete len:94 (-) Transcript_4912:128-409(-)